MKRFLMLFLVLVTCLSLCSCENLLQIAKSKITGQEISKMPDDYVATLENDEYVYELYTEYVKITEYKSEETNVVIPWEIEGKPVTVIGSYCFYDAAPITSVTIPASVKTIEDGAFYLIETLASITIPDTVESIGMRAFAWCNGLETVKLGSGINEIPDYCFNHCISLKTVEIPSNVTKIGVRAFSYCEKLVEQTIPSTVEYLGERSFVDCPALEYVIFENDNIELGKSIFEASEKVVIISNENSNVYNYCAENSLRWSTSKSVEAITPALPESSTEASDDVSSEQTV